MVLDVVESLNKFAVCMHAITGEDLCTSGKLVTDLLRRHGLSAWFVDRLSSFVLSMTTLAFAALTAAATYYLVYVATPAQPAGQALGDTRRAVAGAFSTMAFLLALFILSFCAFFINQVVDAAYTCFALDLDAGAPHQPPLRDVMIPIVKPEYALVVGQPISSDAVAVGQPVGEGFPQPSAHAPMRPADVPLEQHVASDPPRPLPVD